MPLSPLIYALITNVNTVDCCRLVESTLLEQFPKVDQPHASSKSCSELCNLFLGSTKWLPSVFGHLQAVTRSLTPKRNGLNHVLCQEILALESRLVN